MIFLANLIPYTYFNTYIIGVSILTSI